MQTRILQMQSYAAGSHRCGVQTWMGVLDVTGLSMSSAPGAAPALPCLSPPPNIRQRELGVRQRDAAGEALSAAQNGTIDQR